ncbi:MAG: DMT family transporter [Alphaproteobacteria bacterium]|nr:DMT family transporter [Alphaproteobacteria bacterium]
MARSLSASAGDAAGGGLSRAGILLLVVLSLTWGVNWPMMKLALAEIPVWTFRTLCLMVGGSTLLLITRLSGQAVTFPRRQFAAIALVSLFNITGWHLCSAYGLLHTGGGRAAIIGYTMPLWTSLLSVVILKTNPNARQIMALILGMASLLTLLAEDLQTVGGAPLGVLFMALAAFNWGLGTVLVKKVDWSGMSVLALTGWQQLIGGIPIVIGWWLLEPVPDFTAISPPALIGLGYAVFVAMVFCHTAYFKLVAWLPAHVAAMGVMAVPVVGVVASSLILGETIGLAELLALAFVVSSLFLLAQRRPSIGRVDAQQNRQ